MSALIEARGLVKRYGARTVVRRVDLTVAPGEIVAVIGPNGAGKTTTLEMILGIRRPDGGRVTYRLPDPRREMGVQLQATPFFPGLTPAENLQIFAAFYGIRLSRAQAAESLERYGLGDASRTEAARLSGGQQKRLAIALALVHQPKVLFLDEPAALDPQARREIHDLIRRLAAGGRRWSSPPTTWRKWAGWPTGWCSSSTARSGRPAPRRNSWTGTGRRPWKTST